MSAESDAISSQANPGATTRAGLAGAGGGTGLIALSESLSASSSLKHVLLYIAPSASIIFGAIGYVMQVEAARLWRRSVIRRGRREVQAFLDNPAFSDERKTAIREEWEKTEQSLTLDELERMSVHTALFRVRETRTHSVTDEVRSTPPP